MIKQSIESFDELLDSKYGANGSPARESWEKEFESFKLGVLIEEVRKNQLLDLRKDFERIT
jgi:hypothetical protein